MSSGVHIEPHRDAFSNALLGSTLVGRSRRARPRLEIQSARSMVRIALDEKPVLWARVAGYDWAWLPADAVHALLPPIRADRARMLAKHGAGTEEWWLAWMRELAPSIGPLALAERGPRVDLVPLVGRDSPYAHHEVSPRAFERAPWAPGVERWDTRAPCLLPLRAWSAPDAARVKAWRKIARDGALPPIVLRWCSALMTHLVLDGHDRLVAAEAEGIEPARLAVVGVVAPRASLSHERRAPLEASLPTLERIGATGAANRAAIEIAGSLRELRAIDRAHSIPGGARGWRREVGARVEDLPQTLREALLGDERRPPIHFAWPSEGARTL